MSCPTTTPNLLGLRVLHRTMRTDLHRLTALVERLADLRAAIGTKRAKALDAWIRGLCAEIHHHHLAEDEIAWPVIERHAGAAADLTGLSEDHAALGPLLADVREASTALVRGPSAELPAQAGALAGRLARLRDTLDEHIADEEREIFPIIERYVPAAEWDAVTRGVQRRAGGPGAAFQVPRILDVATPEEFAALRAEAGPLLPIMAAALRPGHRRRERLVFG